MRHLSKTTWLFCLMALMGACSSEGSSQSSLISSLNTDERKECDEAVAFCEEKLAKDEGEADAREACKELLYECAVVQKTPEHEGALGCLHYYENNTDAEVFLYNDEKSKDKDADSCPSKEAVCDEAKDFCFSEEGEYTHPICKWADIAEEGCNWESSEKPGNSEPRACTAVMKAGVVIDVYSKVGVITNASATVSRGKDGETLYGIHRDMNGSLVGLYEAQGPFTIEVSAPGYKTRTVDVTLERDECHVITQTLDVTLAENGQEPICTAVAIPGLVVEVLNASGERVFEGISVTATASGSAVQLGLNVHNDTFEGLREGSYSVAVNVPGYDESFDYEVTIELGSDGCHPETETITVQLD